MIERAAIILLVNILFYLKTLGYKYSSDDIPAFHRPKDPIKWRQAFWVLEGRARSNPPTDHAITMAIHALVCLGIYFGFGVSDISFLAALLFSVNPANNQAAVWIAGRPYAWAALGMVGAMALPWVGPLFLLLAAHTNSGYVFPIILGGSKFAWMLIFMPLIWFIHWKRFKKNVSDKIAMEMFTEDREIKPGKLVLATKTFGFYTTLALIPFKNSFYHSFLQSAAGSMKNRAYTMKCRFFWIGVLWIILAASYIGFHIKSWDMVCFGILWWCLGIAPFLNFVRIHQEIAERYVYLGNVGLMVVLATVLVNYPILAAVFLSMYATKMWFYMDCYQDDYYLIENACLNSPDAWFSWHTRAMKRWGANSHQEAVILWTMARMISPKEFKLNLNLATALRLSTNPEHHKEAEKFLQIAEENIPRGQEAACNRLLKQWREGQMAMVL